MAEATTMTSGTSTKCEHDTVLPQDMLFRILLCLPVISLLRFKLVCKSWCTLIQSPAFINQHLHYHHHLKYNNYNLLTLGYVQLIERVCSPLRLFSISGDNYEVPPVKLELDSPCFLEFRDNDIIMVTCNGIICLHIRDLSRISNKLNICLWNPATRKLRVLPQSPFPPPSLDRHFPNISLGFGFDLKTHDYKVVRIVTIFNHPNLTRVQVYSLSTDSWRTIDTVLPVDMVKSNPKSPYRHGLYCWTGGKIGNPSEYELNLCHDYIVSFDFSKEVFGTMSLPDAASVKSDRCPQLAIIKDNIACISRVVAAEHERRMGFVCEIWVLNVYGVKESWTKLYNFSLSAGHSELSKNGSFLFFLVGNQRHMYNLVTQEIKNLPGQGFLQSDGMLPVVEYKESLVSIESGNSRAMVRTCVV